MRACDTCGHLNAPDADFCVNAQCRTFLGWAGQPPPTPPPPPPTPTPTLPTPALPTPTLPTPTPPTPPPPDQPTEVLDTATQPVEETRPLGHEQRAGIRLRLEPADVTVDPGGAVVVRAVAENTGTRVEQLGLRVDGPGGAFATVEPVTLSVYPEATEQAIVTFRPTRGPEHAAGPAPYRVEARSAIHPDVSAAETGVVTVGPYVEVTAELEPPVSRGRKPSRHAVLVANNGNAAADVQVELQDRDGVLTFTPAEAAVAVPAGASVPVPTAVGGPRKVFGRVQSHQFTAVVTPPRGQPVVTLNGVRHQRPLLPWWLPVAALLLLVAAALVIPRLGQARVPKVVGLAAAEAQARLEDAGYAVRVTRRTDPVLANGLAIDTVPGEGETAKKGTEVTLFVSNGVCAGNACPVTVPALQGLPVAEAKTALAKAGLKFAREVVVPSETIGKGRVISSEPAAATSVRRNSDVVLTVSSGPVQREVFVPDVTGLDEGAAVSALTAARLQVVKERRANANRPAGDVLGTDPPANTKVKENSRVKLIVSSGPAVAARDDDFLLFPGGVYDFDANKEGDESAADLLYQGDQLFGTEGVLLRLTEPGTPATFEACRAAELRSDPVPAAQLAEGRVLCVQTRARRLAVVRVKGGGGGSGEFTAEYTSFVLPRA